ncbi:MAG: hypothetical protein ABFC63_08905 [Thermoguttaceae bacterium]
MSEETTAAKCDDSAADCSIADALERAKDELEKAQAFYDRVRGQAAERMKAVRRTTVGDILDSTLEATKRHPVAGLTLAALLGYWLGRIFRR